MTKLWTVLLIGSSFASAQQIELGASAGAGGFTASGPTLVAGQVGAEACLLCEGRFAIFAEYSHWFTQAASSRSNPSDQVQRADLGGGGLRIKGRGRVSPFFDVGIVGGTDTHRAGNGGPLGGVVVGGGLRLPLGGHWYVRPQVRVYGLSPHTLEGVDAHWALSAGAGVGYSW